MKVSLLYFWLDLWQQMTNQVCQCKHTKRHHIKLVKRFADRSDVQCLDFVFTGKAYGDGGLLGCCQCLSYHQRKIRLGLYWYRLVRTFVKEKPRDPEEPLRICFCVCGHNAGDHGMGGNLFPLYPPCQKCKCPEYDYVHNPKVGGQKNQRFSA